MLGERIVEDPTFADSDGAFSRDLMNQIIRQQGFNEDDFVVKRRADYVRAQLVDAFAGGDDLAGGLSPRASTNTRPRSARSAT